MFYNKDPTQTFQAQIIFLFKNKNKLS